MRTDRSHARHTLLAALAVFLLVAGGCEAAPPPGTSHSPSGSVDWVERSYEDPWIPGTDPPQVDPTRRVFRFHVGGWASDWDTTDPIRVMVFLATPGEPSRWVGPYTANQTRWDVHAAFHRGANYGYEAEIVVPESTARNGFACVAALNVGPGDHTLLGCRKPGGTLPST